MTRFSELLLKRSWQHHEQVQGMSYLRALMEGRLGVSGYAAMIGQELFVYEALEQAAPRLRADPVAGPFLVPELTRAPGLRADLRHLLGANWRRALAPSPATRRYVERIREVAGGWPAGFVAHHYTRYLGDLSGGQVIARLVARRYQLVDGRGVQSYAFDGICDPRAFKAAYRARLDAAPWSPAEQDRIVDEVLLAYRLNTEVLAYLARRLGLPSGGDGPSSDRLQVFGPPVAPQGSP